MIHWKNIFKNPGVIIGSFISIFLLLNFSIDRLPQAHPGNSAIATFTSLIILTLILILGYIRYWKTNKISFIIWGAISVFAAMMLILVNASDPGSAVRYNLGYTIFTIPLIFSGLIAKNNTFLTALFFIITSAGYGALVYYLFNKIKNNVLKHVFLVFSIFAYTIISYIVFALLVFIIPAILYGPST